MNITAFNIADDARVNTPDLVRVSVVVTLNASGNHSVRVFAGERGREKSVLHATGIAAFTGARAVMRSYGVPRKTANSMLRSAVAHAQA